MAIEVKENVNLKNYTTFGIGGDADFFCRVGSKEELIEALDWAKENHQDYYVIGGGSNLLISDKGVRGLVILNRNGNYEIKNERVVADSGVNLSMVARQTVSDGYAGLDFATGIPGTIGGAAAGNAGAYGKDMSKVVLAAEVWDDGEIREYFNDDFEYVYRGSRLKGQRESVILSVTVKLERGDKEKMLEAANNDVAKRTSDYGGRNAGSYFTNVSQDLLTDEETEKLRDYIIHRKLVIGKMLDHLGMKGFRVGGAMISENHAGVILNVGDATAADVLAVEEAAISKIHEDFGLMISPEVTKLGEF